MTNGRPTPPWSTRPLEDLAQAVERGEIDPVSASIHDAIEECLEDMRRAGHSDLEDVGNFLAAASALVQAKSKALLPPETAPDGPEEPSACEVEDETEAAADNEALVAHLMEYRVFKDAVDELARRDQTWRTIFSRGSFPKSEQKGPLAPAEVGLVDLILALREILEGMPEEAFSQLPAEDLLLEERMDIILTRLDRMGEVAFKELFLGPATRSEVIAVFLALLELIRLARVIVRQDHHFGEILIGSAPGGPEDGL